MPICPSNVIIFEKGNPDGFKKIETPFNCPKFDKHQYGLSESTEVIASDLKMSVKREATGSSNYVILIES